MSRDDQRLTYSDEELEKAKVVLEKHKTELLAIPGCTGVGIGLKQVGGRETGALAIVVFVQRKTSPPPGEAVPGNLEGVRTDVIEQEDSEPVPLAAPAPMATDPFARFDQLFSGISVTAWETPPAWGTIGCFIWTPGDPGHGIPGGQYLLTNQHVLQGAAPPDTVVIQPSIDETVPPPNYRCGDYVYGYQTPTRDCAIATVGYGRTFLNQVPNYPGWPGRRDIRGVAAAAPGQAVYKYGATSKFTKGVVAVINYTPPNTNYQNVILIRSEGGTNDVWVAKGDSGSVTILQANDYIIGLNFAGSANAVMQNPPQLPAYPAYYRGFAYDIQAQMNAFSATGGVVLA